MQGFEISELEENYSEDVKASGKILSDQFSAFAEKIKDASNGKIIL